MTWPNSSTLGYSRWNLNVVVRLGTDAGQHRAVGGCDRAPRPAEVAHDRAGVLRGCVVELVGPEDLE